MFAIFHIESRRARFVLIVLAAILIAFLAYQYVLFKSEINEMDRYLAKKWLQLIEIRKHGEKVEQRISETERGLSMARALLPAVLNAEFFRADFERWAKASGVIVEDFSWHEEERELYNVAHCAVTLTGDKKGIETLWQFKGELERLVTWGKEEPLDTGVKVKLMIYSAPWPKPKEFDIDAFKQKPCKEFITRVWLWPFSKRIREIQETLDRICPQIGERAEELRNLELLKSKAREVQYLVDVLNHLTKSQQ